MTRCAHLGAARGRLAGARAAIGGVTSPHGRLCSRPGAGGSGEGARGGGEKNGLKISRCLRHTAEPLPRGISWAACWKVPLLLLVLSPVRGAPLGHFGVRIWGFGGTRGSLWWWHLWVPRCVQMGVLPKCGSLYGGSSEHPDVLGCVSGDVPSALVCRADLQARCWLTLCALLPTWG